MQGRVTLPGPAPSSWIQSESYARSCMKCSPPCCWLILDSSRTHDDDAANEGLDTRRCSTYVFFLCQLGTPTLSSFSPLNTEKYPETRKLGSQMGQGGEIKKTKNFLTYPILAQPPHIWMLWMLPQILHTAVGFGVHLGQWTGQSSSRHLALQ